MDERTAVPVPAIPGIDLSFRPASYFALIPLETHLLSRVAGQARREILRRELATGNTDLLPLELFTSLLDEQDRAALASIHPSLMGGEYLPPFLKDEVEIARISLASVTADQISVRAQRIAEGIAYRIVDEYVELGSDYVCRPHRTLRPLTLGELVALIDGAREDGGAAMAPLINNVAGGVDALLAHRNFVSVGSEFYPQLGAYYTGRISSWLDKNHPPEAK